MEDAHAKRASFAGGPALPPVNRCREPFGNKKPNTLSCRKQPLLYRTRRPTMAFPSHHLERPQLQPGPVHTSAKGVCNQLILSSMLQPKRPPGDCAAVLARAPISCLSRPNAGC